MTRLIVLINYIILAVSSTFLLLFLHASVREREFRAALTALPVFFLNGLLWWSFTRFEYLSWIRSLNTVLLISLGIFLLISLLRFFPGRPVSRNLEAAVQSDERDNMFARNNTQFYPELMKELHTLHPEFKETDRAIHARPELGEATHKYFNEYASPCFEAAFEYMEATIPASAGRPAEVKKPVDPAVFARTITSIAKFYGACDVGITPLEAHHFYSHRGRHADGWGEVIDASHKSAVVITIPMDIDMLKAAPSNTVIQESARKYVEVGKISNILAAYIRKFGYEARAHNDANYEVLCVPLAVQAGLGELGRMGILVHNVYGPCVRIAVVTTELELPPTHSRGQRIDSFCRICKKCSDNCPTRSISDGEEPSSRGFRHWSIDQEKCYAFWKEIGSDCGFCIRVCPYTKPNTLIHKLVRFYISRNILNQHIALFMDDLFYGRKFKISAKNPDEIFLNKY